MIHNESFLVMFLTRNKTKQFTEICFVRLLGFCVLAENWTHLQNSEKCFLEDQKLTSEDSQNYSMKNQKINR